MFDLTKKGRRLTLDYSDTGGLRVVDYSLVREFSGQSNEKGSS